MTSMNFKKIEEKYLEIIKFDENLSKYHTFKTSGRANVVIEPRSKEELIEVIKMCKNNNYRFNIIGNGSNILFKDGEYEGVLIVTKKINKVKIDGRSLVCECGVPLPLIGQVALKNELKGFEKLSGIPGTIGGAVLMNAGAYGVEMKDVIDTIEIYHEVEGVKKVTSKELGLRYRHSNVKELNYIILGCTISLEKSNKEAIKTVMDECRSKRLASQPLEYPNAGSIFKKEGEYFAGQLIDDCGLKGFSVGGAMISPKHANFIVNKENATYGDIINLITYVRQAVYIQKNVELHTEIEII